PPTYIGLSHWCPPRKSRPCRLRSATDRSWPALLSLRQFAAQIVVHQRCRLTLRLPHGTLDESCVRLRQLLRHWLSWAAKCVNYFALPRLLITPVFALRIFLGDQALSEYRASPKMGFLRSL